MKRKGKALSLVIVASLLASTLLIGTGSAQFLIGETTRFGIKLPDGTTYMNVTTAEYDIGDKFNITVHIENVDPAMLSMGVSVTWNATFCNATKNWWLSPFMKAEVTAGHWMQIGAPIITNDYLGALSPLIGVFEGLGLMSGHRDYDLTGSFDICIIEFQVNAYGPLGFYIWKDPTHYAPHPYTAGQPYLAYEGAFPEAYHAAYTTYAYPPAGAPANYSVIWVPQFPTMIANALLWIQPPSPYAPVAFKSYTPAFPFENQIVTLTVTQVKPGFDGMATHDISSVTVDWGDTSPTNTTAGPLPIVFYHNYTAAGSYTIGVDCYAAGMPSGLEWHNLTNPITISEVALTGIDVYEVRTDGNFGEGKGIPGRPYDPQALVTLEAYVFYGGDAVQAKLVSFEVTVCGEECILYRTVYTDENGIATLQFRIPTVCWEYGGPESLFGKWHVNVTVDMAEVKYWDWMDFDMGYLLTLTDMASVKDCAEPIAWEVFKKADYVYFNVTIINIDWVYLNATIILVVYDNEMVPIGQEIIVVSVPPGEFCNPYELTTCIGLFIPKYAFVGTGTGYINAFTAIPSECGLAWCPEVSDPFLLQKAA